MDGISAVYAILAVVDIANKSYKLVREIKDADIRMDILRARLLAEKTASETWANQIRLADGRSSIPPDKQVDVEKLYEKLKFYYQNVEDFFEKLETPEGGKRTMVFLRKAFIAGGYARLRDLIDAIKAINDALKAIAPPLPPYSRFVFDESGRSEVHTPYWQIAADSTDSDSPSRDVEDAMVGKIYSIRLRNVYQAAIDGLLALSKTDRAMLQVAARLRLWGVGLFEEPYSLDAICHSSQGDTAGVLRHGILQGMSHILVLEEKQLLGEANVRAGDREQLLDLRMNISALLGTDELIDMALRILGSYTNTVVTLDQDVAYDDDDYSKERPSRSPFPRTIAFGMMSRFVENLFDILPAVRAQQRYYCYQCQTQPETPDTPNQVTVKTGQTSAMEHDRATLRRKLFEVESRIAAHDRLNADAKRWQPAWQKMTERLEERLAPEDVDDQLLNAQAIQARQLKKADIQKQLVEGLEEWLLRQTELKENFTRTPEKQAPYPGKKAFQPKEALASTPGKQLSYAEKKALANRPSTKYNAKHPLDEKKAWSEKDSISGLQTILASKGVL
ncbi:hypothetical protein LTR56_012107 [Elasticomyces elasticus]|nr:hypothetical protein LTR56_012107 [Elasticomyces elasticus]KAK3665719.1 hypothetical protein LTR22_003350 [Elasticomyces elasticus]KAK4896670.1 hypothetical protein LTR49_028112 [Elasticomyces elasticus]KAK5757265.1 hypothetical protein LTS12_012623 [Elasticomyces elasticus]